MVTAAFLTKPVALTLYFRTGTIGFLLHEDIII